MAAVSPVVDREIEAALVVVSSDPADVLARLRELRRVEPYGLEPRSEQRLLDRYLDTPSGALWDRRLALRERWVDGECELALKGQLGPRERLEIAGPQGGATWRRIEAALRAREIRVPSSAWRVIQERSMRRERRAMTSEDWTLAELDLDDVAYRFGTRTVRFFEVEIELEDIGADLDALVRAVQRAVPELREWPYDKLVTGAAMAIGLDKDQLRVSARGALLPESLEQLGCRLAAGQT
ncbi:MAG TPA: CYTH domain-containing protein [Egibacteraceae bacterium]|nr:CYTH domain-containing protein [Egibacteraceae bacterium]